jgi:hypothetical protein
MSDAAVAELMCYAEEEEGLTIAVTPAQLAAVLAFDTVQSGGSVSTRMWGLAKLLGGGLEMAGGTALLLTPEPTMITKVGGGALAAHGADTFTTGATQIWTGRDARTLTDKAVTGLAEELGASRQTAANIGTVVDIAVPLVVVSAAGIARLMSVRAGRISLAAHEAAAGSNVGGHTILKHVGKSEQYLRNRLAQTANWNIPPPAMSSFTSVKVAETAISHGLRANRAAIETWAKGASNVNLTIQSFDAGRTIGYGIIRSTGKLQNMSKLKIVLKKQKYNGMTHYILTSYPVP